MKISKMRFLLCIVFLMTFTIVSGSFGATSQAHQSADKLYTLGLFSGTGVDQTGKPIYDLDRAPTRQEAITMLVKLLGKENVAKTVLGHIHSMTLTSGHNLTLAMPIMLGLLLESVKICLAQRTQ